MNVSSFLEPTFEERWNGNAGPPSVSFIEDPEFIHSKLFIIKNISGMKAWEIHSHKVRVVLYNQAKTLEEQIELYINEKK